jgi:hypothetical protein
LIYNFAISTWVHFSSSFWRKIWSKTVKWNKGSAMPRRAVTSHSSARARAHSHAAAPTSESGPCTVAAPEVASSEAVCTPSEHWSPRTPPRDAYTARLCRPPPAPAPSVGVFPLALSQRPPPSLPPCLERSEAC